MRRVVALLAVLAMTTPNAAQCQNPSLTLEYERSRPLTGWTGFSVLAEEHAFASEAISRGVTDSWIEDLAKLQLRRNRIKFVENGSLQGFLYVNVHPMYVQRLDHFVWSIWIMANRPIPGARFPFNGPYTVWEASQLGIVPAGDLKAVIVETVAELVDQFSIDYLRVNPD